MEPTIADINALDEKEMKYPRDGKDINCWYCELEGKENSDGEELIQVRVFQSTRWICLHHLMKKLLVEFSQGIMNKAYGKWWDKE